MTRMADTSKLNIGSEPYRIIIVDDVPAVREALRWLIEEEADLTVIGEAGNGPEAIRLTADLQPDIVLLDIDLPGLDGYTVARRLKAMPNPPVVIFMTVHSDPAVRRQAAEAGGDDFAEKGKDWLSLLDKIRAGLSGR